MMTSFEIASIFKIKDEATTTLMRMAEKVREFNLQVKEAQENLAAMGRLRLSGLTGRLEKLSDQSAKLRTTFGATFTAMDAGVASATAETRALAEQWRAVAAEVAAAGRAMRGVAVTGAAGAINPRTRIAGSHGGGTGGGGVHVGSLPVPLPGGHASVRVGGPAAMVGAGALAYGIYEEAQFEDAAFRAMFTAGVPADKAERSRRLKELRDIIQDAATRTGKPIGDIEEATLTGIRQFAGMPWEDRLKILPELLRGAATESILKGHGTTVNEAMEVFTGLAHMTKNYSPEAIKKLIPKFAYLSTVDPEKIKQMEKAASYAVPILQSGLEIDPSDVLLLVAALQRGGVTNTKAGTWIREMAIKAMPGTSLMSKVAFKKHEEALRAFGLVDDAGKPTWFTDGKPDIIKMLDIAGEHARNIPLTRRAAYERQLFGAQGAGAEAILADDTVIKQVHILREEMERFKPGEGFFEDYLDSSPVQEARTAWADTQKLLMDIGEKVLPTANDMLRSFDAGLKGLSGTLGSGVLGTIVAAGLGAFAGSRVAGAPGALVGGIAGAASVNKLKPAGEVTWGDWWNHLWENPAWSLFGIGAPTVPGDQSMVVPPVPSSVGVGLTAPSANKQSFVVQPYVPTGFPRGSEADRAAEMILAGAAARDEAADQKRPIQVTTVINLDGRKLAEAVTKHQARDGAGPVEGSPYHDSTYSTSPMDFALPY